MPSSSSTPTKRSSSGGITCTRVTLIVFNVITLFAGIATLAIGLLLFFASHVENSSMDILEHVAIPSPDDTVLPKNREFKGLSIVLIGLGTLVAFVSFLGCFGACINGKCLLVTYLISVGLILTLQFLVSVFAIIYRQPMTTTLRQELISHIRHDYRPDSDIDKTWGLIHQTFDCCGVDGFSDWFGVDAWPGQQFVPDSCCIDATNITGCGTTVEPNLWHKKGCLGNIQLIMMEKLHYLAGAIIALVFLQLYGIIGSTLLFYHVKEPKNKSQSYNTYSYELANTRRSK